MRRPPVPPDLLPLLEYLGAIGYGDLYLRDAAGAASSPGAGAARSVGSPPDAADEPGAVEQMAERAAAPGGSGEPPAPRGAIEPAALAARVARLTEISGEVAVCRLCRLCETRNRTVFGAGDAATDLLFIGEGPGAEEDKQGLPFVGRAGELLNKIIQAIGKTREQVYIANIVKCRPPGNRDPQPDEVAACRPYLAEQIGLIQPAVIVALGRIAAQTLLGNDTPIGRLRGRWYTVLGVPTMVTYHPAALLRNPALKRPTWEDMQQVRDRLLEAAAGS
jgi:uracil-DNA glycosylase family 4